MRRASFVTVLIASVIAIVTVPSHTAGSTGRDVPRFTALRPFVGRGPSKQATNTGPLPTWTGSFTFQGKTYTHTMVGTDPAAGSHTTTVPVAILPVRIRFASGEVFDPTPIVGPVTRSPLFRDAGYGSGTTQYADAMQRA